MFLEGFCCHQCFISREFKQMLLNRSPCQKNIPWKKRKNSTCWQTKRLKWVVLVVLPLKPTTNHRKLEVNSPSCTIDESARGLLKPSLCLWSHWSNLWIMQGAAWQHDYVGLFFEARFQSWTNLRWYLPHYCLHTMKQNILLGKV